MRGMGVVNEKQGLKKSYKIYRSHSHILLLTFENARMQCLYYQHVMHHTWKFVAYCMAI